MRRLASAIAALDGRLHGVDADELGIELDPETLGSGANFPLETTDGRLDVFQQLGDRTLHELVFENPVEIEIDGIEVFVCSLAALRTLKEEAGRPQDVADIAALDGLDEHD